MSVLLQLDWEKSLHRVGSPWGAFLGLIVGDPLHGNRHGTSLKCIMRGQTVDQLMFGAGWRKHALFTFAAQIEKAEPEKSSLLMR